MEIQAHPYVSAWHPGGRLQLPPPVADRSRVLVVDDIPTNRLLIRTFLQDADCDVIETESGEKALCAAISDHPDLVLLDVQMPGMNGFDVCGAIRANPATRRLPIVMLTALNSVGDHQTALEAGSDDFLAKPVDRLELRARVASALRLEDLHDRLDDAERVIFALATKVAAKDRFTESHTVRVAAAAVALGDAAGMGPGDLDLLHRGGLIHDIGKIAIPDAILLKVGPLDLRETAVMRTHPVRGEEIARPLRSARHLLPIIRHHHERIDGRGYPDALVGEEIPLLARIVTIADAFDALTSDRSYRAAIPVAAALQVLADGAGTQWDASLVAIFIEIVGDSAGRLPCTAGQRRDVA